MSSSSSTSVKGVNRIIQLFCFVEPSEGIDRVQLFSIYPGLNSQHRAQELRVINLQRQAPVLIFFKPSGLSSSVKKGCKYFFLCVITNVANQYNCCSEESHKRAYALQGHVGPRKFKAGFARNPKILKVPGRFFLIIFF